MTCLQCRSNNVGKGHFNLMSFEPSKQFIDLDKSKWAIRVKSIGPIMANICKNCGLISNLEIDTNKIKDYLELT